MDNSPALLSPSPPFPPPPSRSSESDGWSALEYIVSFLALVTIPTLIYTFFFFLKCPPIPSRRRHRRSEAFLEELSSGGGGNTDNAEVISDIKYRKDTHVIDIGSECPVCLSEFNDGEEVRQLMSCKHFFHAPCIDLWLHSHSNCPICRASVPLKPSKVSIPSREEDRREASPDSARLP